MYDCNEITKKAQPLSSILCPTPQERDIDEHCVYFIISDDNMVYVGETRNFAFRIYKHVRFLKTGKHSNSFLQHDFINKGINSFRCGILKYCSEDMRRQEEEEAIDFFASVYDVYNGKKTTKPKLKTDDKADISIKLSESTIDKVDRYIYDCENYDGECKSIDLLIEEMILEGIEYRESVLFGNL